MPSEQNLVSLKLEMGFLGGLINHPDVIAEVDGFVTDRTFSNSVHSTIFSVLRRSYLNGEPVDKVTIAQKVQNLGIHHYNDLVIFDYLKDICFTQINKKAVIEAGKELAKLLMRREICLNADEVKRFIIENGDKSISELISGADGIYNKKINQYQEDNKPIDLYAGIEDFLKGIANNPQNYNGLKTPFDCWNRYLGEPQTKGAINIIAGRMGEGKSVFLFNIGKEMAKLNNCKCLYLDAEMDKELNMFRAGSIESDVNISFLQRGTWIKNPILAKKVTDSFEKINKYKGHLYYMYVPNKGISEILSIIRRWKYSFCGRDEKAILIYDYLKISSDFDSDRTEWAQIGDKVSYLNEITHDLNLVSFAGAQQNRTGRQNGKRIDDDTTIGLSDRILQYAGSGGIFRRKTLDEITDFGLSFGKFLLKPVKTSRNQGEECWDDHKLVRIQDHHTGKPKYEDNFINYDINSYRVEEKGTYADIVNHHNFGAQIQKKKDNPDEDDGSLE